MLHTSVNPYEYWCLGACANDVSPPLSGGTILMGGGTDVDAAFKQHIAWGGFGDFLVLRASGTDAYNPYIFGLDSRVHSAATLLTKSRAAASDPFVLGKVAKADAIFFAGGDQSKYYAEWADTPLQTALRAAVARGVPIGGTSAGCDVQAAYAYTGANGSVTSRTALRNPFDEEITLRNGSFVTHEPAGLLSNVLPDTHFVTRDRAGRMLAFLARFNGSVTGIGIDERTAIAIDKHGNGTVLAQGSRGGRAFIFKPSGPARTCKPHMPLDFESVRVQRLTTGDSYDFVSMAGGKASQRYEVSVVDGAFVQDPYKPPAALVSTCTTSSDCSLAGECISQRCVCDAGWMGDRCERLHLTTSRAAIKSHTDWSWGGLPARDPSTGVWHLFYSYMVKQCGLLHYQTNSLVRHAISYEAADGPWRDVGVALAPRPSEWDSGNIHVPVIRFDASTKQWLLFYESTGWKHGPIDCVANRSAPSVYVSSTRRIGVAAAQSLNGPWERLSSPILAPREPSAWDSSDVSNAAPHVFPNGTVLLGYRAGGDSVALGGGIGIAVAPSWRGPYHRRGPSINRMLFAAEDGAIFPSVVPSTGGTYHYRGLHMLVHRFAHIRSESSYTHIPPNGSKIAEGVGGHAYSIDGLEWTYDERGAPAYDNSVKWASNGSTTRLYRRERPQPLIDAVSGRLLRLFNGAWPCHVGAETDDARDAPIGCASFTLVSRVADL